MAVTGLIWAVRTQAIAESRMAEIVIIRQEVHDIYKEIKEVNNRIDRMDTPLSKRVMDNTVVLDKIRERISSVEGKIEVLTLGKKDK
jgi:hypothetical protein